MQDHQPEYRLFFEKHPNAMWVYDEETFRFLAVNEAAVLSYGYSREEFLAMRVTEIRPPEDVPRFLAFKPKAKRPFRNAGVWRHVRKDGAIIDVEISASDVVFEGRPAVLVSAADVTERRRMEASLIESEARLRTYLEAASEGVVVVGRDGRIEYVNAKMEEMFGYRRDELLGHTLEILIPERYRAAHESHRSGYLENPRMRGMGIGLELTARRKDGSEFPVEVGLSAVAAADGIVQIGFVNDISVRKHAEQALRESEQRLRNLVETTSDLVWEADENGVYRYVSPQVRGILGYEPEELTGRTPFDFMPAEDALHLRERFTQIAASHGGLAGLERNAFHKNGSVVVLETNGLPVFDEGGALRGFRGIDRDITERKRSEQALRASQESLVRAQRIAHLGNWERDVRSGELTWSDEVYRIFRMDPGCFRPTLEGFHRMVHPDDLAAMNQAVQEAFRTGKPYTLDHRIVLADGTERHVHEHAEVLRDETGTPVRLLGTVQDVTEYKRLEEQLRQSQRMEAVGRLAGGVAHDFNNLLTIISGYSELTLAQLPPDHVMRRDLAEVSRAAERAAALTRQLLAFSRKQILQLKILNLNAVMIDLDKMLRRLIGEDIELCTLLAPQLGLVKADPTQIDQVILNLAVNARDAMPGGGRLLIETANIELDDHYARSHPEVQPGSYVMVAVTDTGIGMDSGVLPHIFEPFFTTKPREKGTGLGLSTVYGIVKQSGGSIFVYSEAGRGTTFKIYFPLIEDMTGVLKPRLAAVATPRGSETILVVEDEEGVRMLVRTILAAHGYKVLQASRGKEALEVLAAQTAPVDLMITDVVMPEMSGRELAHHAAAVWPGMKVLYMSGYTDEAIVQHGVLDSGTPFLQKPFTHDALTRRVREVLEGKTARARGQRR